MSVILVSSKFSINKIPCVHFSMTYLLSWAENCFSYNIGWPLMCFTNLRMDNFFSFCEAWWLVFYVWNRQLLHSLAKLWLLLEEILLVLVFPTYLSPEQVYVHPSRMLQVVHNLVFELVGDAVVNVYINHEKKFAFVEMRTVEEASNAMALDGIIFEACKFLSIFIFILVSESCVYINTFPIDFSTFLWHI